MSRVLNYEVVNFLLDRVDEAKCSGKNCIIINKDVGNNRDVIRDYYSDSTISYMKEHGIHIVLICNSSKKEIETKFGKVTLNNMIYNIELQW